tara:strand:+ start:1452 stop:2429 length:978 start_codon:yes stop_codon:yes gene_type:complete
MINKNDSLLFIGLGGAGQRHLRILRKLLPENKFYALRKRNSSPLLMANFEVDNSSTIEDKYKVKSFYYENDLKGIKPKITIISTPTITHTNYSLLAKKLGSNVFVEKPGISSKEDIDLLEKTFGNSTLFFKVGFQRSYHPIFKKVLEEIKKDDINEKYYCTLRLSSFVPDWHPYEDFKNLYACQKNLGGGVILTECHEINIVNKIFGKPLQIQKKLYKDEKYKLNVFDSAEFKVKYERCDMISDISFMRKPNERTINIINKNGDIQYFMDFNKNELLIEKNNKKTKKNYEIDNDYLFELQAKNLISLKNNNSFELESLRNLSKFI